MLGTQWKTLPPQRAREERQAALISWPSSARDRFLSCLEISGRERRRWSWSTKQPSHTRSPNRTRRKSKTEDFGGTLWERRWLRWGQRRLRREVVKFALELLVVIILMWTPSTNSNLFVSIFKMNIFSSNNNRPSTSLANLMQGKNFETVVLCATSTGNAVCKCQQRCTACCREASGLTFSKVESGNVTNTQKCTEENCTFVFPGTHLLHAN